MKTIATLALSAMILGMGACASSGSAASTATIQASPTADKKLTRQWNRASDDIRKGEKLIANAQDDIEDGEKTVRKATKQLRKGEDKIAEAEADIRRGQRLIDNAKEKQAEIEATVAPTSPTTEPSEN